MNRPSPFVLAATNNGTMILNHLDKHENSYGSYGVGYQFLSTGGFDESEISTIFQLLQMRREYFGDNVFMLDCGANIGAHTINLARQISGCGGGFSPLKRKREFIMLCVEILR